ncbi:MAG: XylR N-terminal domain-containing protein, partial [Carboxydocellales bacterium]
METDFVMQGKELLDFRLDEGRILLKDIRMLLINAQAMGTLRKDLIATLGQERAKGFLTRYGWACGSIDAYNLMG